MLQYLKNPNILIEVFFWPITERVRSKREIRKKDLKGTKTFRTYIYLIVLNRDPILYSRLFESIPPKTICSDKRTKDCMLRQKRKKTHCSAKREFGFASIEKNGA